MSNFITSLRDDEVTVLSPIELPLPSSAERRSVLKVLSPIKARFANGKLTWDWLPNPGQAHLLPFLHFGWVRMPAKAGGTGLHPHSGLETVTLLTLGGYRHESRGAKDSELGPGSVEYQMTGSGIWHQEHTLGDIGFEAYQLTLALPKTSLKEAPIYRVYEPELIEHEKKADYDMLVMVGGLSPLKPRNHFTFVMVRLEPEQRAHLPAALSRQAFVCVVSGEGRFGEGQQALKAEDLAVLGPGEGLTVQADSMPLSFFLAAGNPFAE